MQPTHRCNESRKISMFWQTPSNFPAKYNNTQMERNFSRKNLCHWHQPGSWKYFSRGKSELAEGFLYILKSELAKAILWLNNPQPTTCGLRVLCTPLPRRVSLRPSPSNGALLCLLCFAHLWTFLGLPSTSCRMQ